MPLTLHDCRMIRPCPVLRKTDNDENAGTRGDSHGRGVIQEVAFALSHELVAREANVAKATLYSYFKNRMNSSWPCAHAWRAAARAVEQH